MSTLEEARQAAFTHLSVYDIHPGPLGTATREQLATYRDAPAEVVMVALVAALSETRRRLTAEVTTRLQAESALEALYAAAAEVVAAHRTAQLDLFGAAS